MADRPKRAVPPDGSPAAVRLVEPDTGTPSPRPGRPRNDARWVRRLPAVMALCAVAAVGALLVRFQAPDEPVVQATSTPPAAPPTVEIFREPDGRFRVGIPAGWELVTEDTPTGNGYIDVFSAATFATRSLMGACPQWPMQALEDMSAGDAFVWVEQGSAGAEPAPRSASSADLTTGVDAGHEAYACLSPEGRADLGSLQSFAFTAAGATYWGLVASGRDASHEQLAKAASVLDSFDPAIRTHPGHRFAALGWDGSHILAITSVRSGGQPPDQGIVTALDPDTGEALYRIPLSGAPSMVAGSDEALWVAQGDTGALERLDPATGAGRTSPVFEPGSATEGTAGIVPRDIAVDGDVLWVLTGYADIAEVRDGGGYVTSHDLDVGAPAHVLEVVAGTPWVAAGRAVHGLRQGEVTSVALDHLVTDLAVTGDDQLLVAGSSGDGVSLASLVDTDRGEVVGQFSLDAPVRAVVTIEGVTGVLDTDGVLHTREGEARLTDVPRQSVLGQAGSRLWAAPDQASWIFDVHFVEPQPPEPVEVQPLPEAERGNFQAVRGPEDRFRVAVPADWEVTTDSLSPLGGVGGDLFGAGTFEMQPTRETCVHLPALAVEDMGPSDAFVWVEEGGSASSAGDQPRSFAEVVDGVDEGNMIYGCLTPLGRAELGVLEWITFSRAGRDFYAIVAVGRDASARRLSEAVAVLDSFDPALRLGIGIRVTDLAWDGQLIWALTGVPAGDGPPPRGVVVGVDPVSGEQHLGEGLAGAPALLAADAGSVWVALSETGSLVRIDPTSGAVGAEVELEPPPGGAGSGVTFVPDALVMDGGVVWVLTAHGVLAEVAGDDDVTIHRLHTDEQLQALAVVEGVPWVASGTAVSRVDGAGGVTPVDLDHFAERLGTDSDRLIVAGQVVGGGNRVTSLDARTGEIIEAFDVPGGIAGIVTIEGMTGALDTDGVLHVEARAVALTDLVHTDQPMVQAGADLYVATTTGLRRVRLVGEHGAGR